MRRLLRFKYIFLVLIFAFLASYSLLYPGLIPTHDGEYHVIRFHEFYKTLSSGVIYPRWAPDLNYGYGVPLFNYNYPLPNYIASLFHVFGISFINSFKLNLFVAIIAAGIFFYLWAKIFFGEKGGLVGAVFYLFSPYLFIDTYVRGSVGEMWAIALFPAFLWAITNAIQGKKRQFFLLSLLFLTLIIFSHNILSLMFFPFAFIYSLFIIYNLVKDKAKKVFTVLLIFLLSLGLSSIFWLPAILETKYVVGLQIFDYKRNFPEIYQLIFPSWGSGFFGGGLGNEMSVQIGLANLIGVILGVFTLFKLKKKNFEKKLIIFFLIWFFVVVFLMLKSSLFLWENLPLIRYFQFPWRLLSLIMLICAFLTSSVFSLFKSRLVVLGLILLTFLLSVSYSHPAYYLDRNDNYYISRSNFIDGTNSIGNSFNTVWFKSDKIREEKKITSFNAGAIKRVRIKPEKYLFNVQAIQDSKLVVNTAFFPGWQAKINNNLTKVGISEKGLIEIEVPRGDHSIQLNYAGTRTQSIASLIALGSLLLVIIISIKKWYII